MGVPGVILAVVGVYLGLGVLLGPAWLLLRGAKADPALRNSKKSLRLLLIPGAVAVWPALLLGGKRGAS